MEANTKFIKEMNETLKRTGYRVSEVARRIGYSPEVVRQVLNGSRPLSEALKEKLEGAKAELEKLDFGGGDNEPPPKNAA